LSLTPLSSGLDAWLKHNGVEVSKTLLLDDHNQPLPIPEIRRTILGNIQTWVMRPYPYLVEVRDAGLKDRAVTAKLDAVGIYWGSPIDVQAPKDVKVTPLLQSSDKSWTDDDLEKVSHVAYTVPAGTKPHLIAAALQGRFESLYKGKPAPSAPGDSIHHDVPIDQSPETRVVVVGNSEFVSDLVARALGSRQQGGLFSQNLGFVQNLIDWMNLDNDLVSIRTRSATARPIRRLERPAAVAIEVVNYLIPLVALALFGLARFWRRRRVAPIVRTGAGATAGA
jgi:ABC-2 type transport system permease protein